MMSSTTTTDNKYRRLWNMGPKLIEMDTIWKWAWAHYECIFPNSQLIRRNPNPNFVFAAPGSQIIFGNKPKFIIISTLFVDFDSFHIKFHLISLQIMFFYPTFVLIKAFSIMLFMNELNSLRDYVCVSI